MQKGQAMLWLVVGLLSIGLVAGGAYYLAKQTVKPQDVRCTLEAKICPDGSSVGRVGPNCEFAQCSQEKAVRIESIKYIPNCSLEITLNSDKEQINIGQTQDCSLVYPSQISPDKKYVAFELRLLSPIEPNGIKLYADNTLFVYFASKRDWVKVYRFGAAEVANMTYDDDNNLKVTLLYEGKETNEIKIRVPEIAQKFDQVVDQITHELNSSEPFW